MSLIKFFNAKLSVAGKFDIKDLMLNNNTYLPGLPWGYMA